MAIDYGARSAGVAGDSIYSTHSGTVVESRVQINTQTGKGWGQTVLVESDSGNYRTRYSHMDGRSYNTGDTVPAGSTVGQMGDSGSPGSVHLDYAVYVKDPDTGEFYAVDPAEAAGKNLDDPAVRDALIEDAKTKVDGELKASGEPKGDTSDVSATSTGGSSVNQVGCDTGIRSAIQAKQQALQQQETEAAKAIITQPTSVQQLTCFDQYAQVNADEIGRIHSDPPAGISDTIAPIVEMPAMQNLISNFLTNILGGGLQSMFSGAIDSLGLGGGGGGSGNCPMMDQMWQLLQCVDFPQMPSLNDIMGGGGEMSGLLSGLGSFGGGSGIMGQVCSGISELMGGGGSGSTSAYQDAIDKLGQDYGDDSEGVFDEEAMDELETDIRDSVTGEGQCDKDAQPYDVRIDVIRVDGEIGSDEFILFDTNGDCAISEEEILAYESLIESDG